MLYSPGMKSNSFLTNCWGENQTKIWYWCTTSISYVYKYYTKLQIIFWQKTLQLQHFILTKIFRNCSSFDSCLSLSSGRGHQLQWPGKLCRTADTQGITSITIYVETILGNKILILKGYFYGSRLTARNLAVADNRGRNKLGICAKHKHYFFTIWTDR